MKRLFFVIALLVVSLWSMVLAAANPAPQWEELGTKPELERELPAQQEAIEVVVYQGAVYITTNQPLKVEVFSILGQLVTSRQVPEGTVKLNLRQRGVYILKAGSFTKRINL